MKSLSRVWLFGTPWTISYQAPRSMGFSRQEYWSGLPFPSPGDLPDAGIEPKSPALQADALPSHQGSLGCLVDSLNLWTPVLQFWEVFFFPLFSDFPSFLPLSLLPRSTVTPLRHALLELLLCMYQSSWISLLIYFSFLFSILFPLSSFLNFAFYPFMDLFFISDMMFFILRSTNFCSSFLFLIIPPCSMVKISSHISEVINCNIFLSFLPLRSVLLLKFISPPFVHLGLCLLC